jgi:hypothetical protein
MVLFFQLLKGKLQHKIQRLKLGLSAVQMKKKINKRAFSENFEFENDEMLRPRDFAVFFILKPLTNHT